MNGYIYCITNKINGKQYVGKTMDTIEQRFKEHIRDSKNIKDRQRPLYYAINKYGIDNFSIVLLEECPENIINECEQFWINTLGTFSNGYNATLGGDGNTLYDHDAIWNKYQELQNIQATARFFGCDRRVVRGILNKHGIYNASKGKPIPIYQLDKNTLQIISEFPSIKNAADTFNKATPSLHSALKDINKTAFGFRWCKKEDYNTLSKPQRRVIQQIDIKTNEIIKEYNSYTEAAISLGKKNGNVNIRKVCKNERKTAYGYS